jgi:tetratricopeptide (TPR) repeat protein
VSSASAALSATKRDAAATVATPALDSSDSKKNEEEEEEEEAADASSKAGTGAAAEAVTKAEEVSSSTGGAAAAQEALEATKVPAPLPAKKELSEREKMKEALRRRRANNNKAAAAAAVTAAASSTPAAAAPVVSGNPSTQQGGLAAGGGGGSRIEMLKQQSAAAAAGGGGGNSAPVPPCSSYSSSSSSSSSSLSSSSSSTKAATSAPISSSAAEQAAHRARAKALVEKDRETQGETERLLKVVEQCKAEGVQAFKEERLAEAAALWSRGIDLLSRAGQNLAGQASTALALKANRAFAYLQLGRHEDAVADCNDVLAADPGNVKAMYRRGLARKEMGDLGGARQDMGGVLDREPANTMAQAEMEMLGRMGVGGKEERRVAAAAVAAAEEQAGGKQAAAPAAGSAVAEKGAADWSNERDDLLKHLVRQHRFRFGHVAKEVSQFLPCFCFVLLL